jgi:hypothetical protein
MDQQALRELEGPGRLRATIFFDEDLGYEVCQVKIVGDPTDMMYRVKPEIINRFPKEWELYQKQAGKRDDEPIEGTPIREVPGVDRDAAVVLRYNMVRTAEEFAALDEQTARGFGAGYIAMWKAAKLLVESKTRKAETDRIAELEAKLAALEDKPRRGPGRPRKEESETLNIPDNET